MAAHELTFSGLMKYYGKKLALDDMNLTVRTGICGLLGPNGAGKSTLINLITDNLRRETGSILWDGHEILKWGAEFRKILGYMPQQQGYYADWDAEDFLIYMARLKGAGRAEARKRSGELLAEVGLSGVKRDRIGSFSGGMKQRLLFAQSLISDPQLLILDEPTAGIDPSERIFIRNYISRVAGGRIVLLATHIVSDIEAIADRIIILKAGKILRYETPETLTAELRGEVFESEVPLEKMPEIYRMCQVSNERRCGTGMLVRTIGRETGLALGGRETEPGLEDVYLRYFPNERG